MCSAYSNPPQRTGQTVQPELGLVTQNGENSHLDTVDGRVWLRLEWRALGEALSLSGDDRLRAVQDALAFRSERRALFSDAEENERVEEIREGLAQYTGTVVTATSEAEAVASALDQLEAAENQESFVCVRQRKKRCLPAMRGQTTWNRYSTRPKAVPEPGFATKPLQEGAFAQRAANLSYSLPVDA